MKRQDKLEWYRKGSKVSVGHWMRQRLEVVGNEVQRATLEEAKHGIRD